MRYCPVDWRRLLLACVRQDNAVQKELLDSGWYGTQPAGGGAERVDPATGRELARGPRPRGVGVENPFHSASSIPMARWTPDLFKNARIV